MLKGSILVQMTTVRTKGDNAYKALGTVASMYSKNRINISYYFPVIHYAKLNL